MGELIAWRSGGRCFLDAVEPDMWALVEGMEMPCDTVMAWVSGVASESC